GPNAVAQLARFWASPVDGMRALNPASSSGLMPALAYASTIGSSAETGLLIGISIRAVCAPNVFTQGSSYSASQPTTEPTSSPPGPGGAGVGGIVGPVLPAG